LAEQDGAEPVVLHGVGDGEGDLGALGAVGFAFPAGVGDHAAVGAGGDQAVVVLVDFGGPADGAVEVGEAAEEPQRDRPRRQALEEGTDGRRVLRPNWPHVHG
jgi:hypothetical protein